MMPSRCCTEINNNCPVGSAVNSAFLTGLFSLYEIFYGFPQFAECFFSFLMCSIGGAVFVFGLLPSVKASRLYPINALRYE